MVLIIITTALLGTNRADINTQNQFIACILIITGVWFRINWRLKSVCLSWLITYPTHFMIALKQSLPVLSIKIFEHYKFIAGIVLCAALMYLSVSQARHFIDQYMLPLILGLTLLIIVGIVSYCISTILLQRSIIEEVRGLIKK